MADDIFKEVFGPGGGKNRRSEYGEKDILTGRQEEAGDLDNSYDVLPSIDESTRKPDSLGLEFSSSSAYSQALDEVNDLRWRVENIDLGSNYAPQRAEFEGVNGDMEISDEALIDSVLVSYSPSEDVVPESESHHAAIFHAVQTLAENGAEAVGDRIQASGVSEDQVEEVVQAYEVLDRSLGRTQRGISVGEYLEDRKTL